MAFSSDIACPLAHFASQLPSSSWVRAAATAAVILDLATYEQMLEDLEGLPLDEALAAA